VLTLYQFPTSPFCEKVRRILNYKRIEFKIIDVPRREIDKFKAISSTGKFPAIEYNGTTVFDSTDIAYFLERLVPLPPLIPTDPHQAAMVHVLEDWADESLYYYELAVRLSWRHNFEKKAIFEFLPTLPWLDFDEAARTIPAMVGEAVARQGLGRKPAEMIVNDVRRHFEALDGFLSAGEWLGAREFSLSDIAVAVQVRAILYAAEAEAIVAQFPRIAEWLSRVNSLAPDEPVVASP